jgi:arylsulfatase A-like enzyme
MLFLPEATMALLMTIKRETTTFPHSKTQLYEDGINMLLIICYPQVGLQPRQTDTLASAIDIAPTVLELAGLAKAATIQGVSLVPVLNDPRAKMRVYVFAAHNWHNFAAHVRLVRTGDEVYMVNAYPDLPLDGTRDSPNADALRLAREAGKLTPVPRWKPSSPSNPLAPCCLLATV